MGGSAAKGESKAAQKGEMIMGFYFRQFLA